MNVRRTWVEERIHGALRLRALRSFGLRVSDIRCRISTPISVYGTQTEAPQRMVGAFGVFRQTSVDGFQAPDVVVSRLATIHPQVVHGNPGLLARIAHTVDHDTLRSLRLRFIAPGGETLTPLMRRQIEEGFTAPVYEVYGAHEFNLIAWQCLTTGELHCCDDGMIMEILDGGRPVAEGEPGEVVGTNLHSFAMPLIRYRLKRRRQEGPRAGLLHDPGDPGTDGRLLSPSGRTRPASLPAPGQSAANRALDSRIPGDAGACGSRGGRRSRWTRAANFACSAS